MGELGASLLKTIGIANGVPGAVDSPVGVVPPEHPGGGINGMTEAVMGFPSVARGGYGSGPNPDGSMSAVGGAPAGMSPSEADAVVQGFKPKHISFWGALGDQLLKHWGNDPVFSKRIEDKNMMKAMQGFTQDPTEAIRRIGQIPGHQKDAWDLFNSQQDNTRMQGTLDRQNRALDLANERVIFDRTAGMMTVATPDNWPKMREAAIKTAAQRGVDVSSVIPEQYDPDAIEFIRYGTIKPKDAIGLDIKERNVNSQISHRNAQDNQAAVNEGGRNARANQAEGGRNARATQAEAGRDRRYTPKAGAAGGKIVSKLPDGSKVEYNSDKTKAAVTRPDGRIHWLQKQLDGHWKTVAPPVKK